MSMFHIYIWAQGRLRGKKKNSLLPKNTVGSVIEKILTIVLFKELWKLYNI